MNYIDTMMSNTVSWVNKGINFILEFKFLFVIGFVAMMASKLLKIDVKI